jgi:hypothetical protein
MAVNPSADEILTSRRLRRRLNRLAPEYRQQTSELLRAVVPKLTGVRRPADLETLLRDDDLLAMLEANLYPVVERAIESANRRVLPLRRRYSSHFVVTLTGLAGPAAANATEVQGLIAMLFPPAGAADLAVNVPAAVLIGLGSQLVEFYVELSVVATRLRDAGISDTAIVRHPTGTALSGCARVEARHRDDYASTCTRTRRAHIGSGRRRLVACSPVGEWRLSVQLRDAPRAQAG